MWQSLQGLLPAGWESQLEEWDEQTYTIKVESGSCIRVCARRAVTIAAPETASGRNAQAPGSGHTGAEDGSRGQEPIRTDPTWEIDSSLDGDDATEAEAVEPGEQVGEQQFLDGIFLVLGQNYTAELIQLRLEVGLDVNVGVQRVAAARAPRDVCRLPVVCLVNPQPRGDHAIVVALPEWPFAGVIVAFDCRQIDGRLFCLHLTAEPTREGLLIAAGISEHRNFEVYVGDMPWALPRGDRARLQTGDLVYIAPLGGSVHVVTTAQDMLLSPTGWSVDFAPEGEYGEFLWAVGMTRSFLHELDPSRRNAARRDLAQASSILERELHIKLATPPITDYAHLGRQARNVAAVYASPDRDLDEGQDIVCFVDLRAILLDFSWFICRHGILEHARLDRFRPRCPQGFEVGLLQQERYQTVSSGSLTRVRNGETIAIVFRRCMGQSAIADRTVDHSAAQTTDDADNDHSGSTAPGAVGPSHETQPSGGPASQGAGTGGTECKSAPTDTASSGDRCNKWLSPFNQDALPEGQEGVTSVLWHFAELAALGAWVSLCTFASFILAFCLRHRWTCIVCCIALQSGGCMAVQIVPVHSAASPGTAGIHVAHGPYLTDKVVAPTRAIPTPCRNGTGSRSADSLAFVGDIGPTLLEECFRLDAGEAFFLAATLVETLFEHFERADNGAEAWSPRQLSITDCLPAQPAVDLTRVSLNINRSLDDIAPFFHTKWSLTEELPSGVRWHDQTVAALRGHVVLDFSTATGLEIFTDGAYDGDISSWAFVVLLKRGETYGLHGWARGRVRLSGGDTFIGAASHGALEGERSALFWATAWLLQCHFTGHVAIWSDCLVAKGQTVGEVGSSQASTLAIACRDLALAVEAAGRVKAGHYGHVRAHAGHPYNELVDHLAKQHRRPDTSVPPPFCSLPEWIADGSLSWMWMLIEATRRPHIWPHLVGTVLVDSSRSDRVMPQPRARFLSLQKARPVADQLPSTHIARPKLDLKLVTVNVQTLEEDRDKGFEGRVPYIRHQIDWIGANVIALQETRAKSTETVHSATHCRFTSAADEGGNYGVELWFSKTVPFAWMQQDSLRFDEDDFRVISWSPRHLFVRFVRGSTRLFFMTCHAPTAVDPGREKWWKAFADKAIGLAKGDPVVLMGDFNVRFIEEWEGRVGSLCWEKGPDPPVCLLRTLNALDLWVPSTFEDVHEGMPHTWSAPGKGTTSRIDYICIPSEWSPARGSSRIMYDVDFGQTGADHFAVWLEVKFHATSAIAPKPHRPRIDLQKLVAPDSGPLIEDLCAGLPDMPWECDAHTHYDIVAEHLVTGLAEAFPAKRTRRRQCFISDATWGYRQQRVWLRKAIHKAVVWLNGCELRTALQAWQSSARLIHQLRAIVGAVIRRVGQLRIHVQELRALKPVLRRSLKTDRRTYLSEVASQAAASSVKSVVAKLRPLLGPPRRKLRGPKAVPAVLMENGEVAADAGEAEARWVRHFSEIEAGGPLPAETIAEDCFSRQAARQLDDLILDREEVPTRTQLEHSMRSSPCDRAAGKDGIPPDFLHKHSGKFSRHLYTLLLKLVDRLEEPLQWKGGELHKVYKLKGSPISCENYRAILVSSAVGKSVHGAFRNKFSWLLDAAAMPLQVGGRKGFPVQLAIHAARLFQQACVDRKKPHGLIFVDLKEAFHRVARQLVHGGSVHPAHVDNLVRTLGLAPEVVPLLSAYVTEGSLLRKAGGSEWTAQIFQEFSEDSWFTHGSGESTARVHSGTRPGDNLADMVFSFLFAEILAVLRRRLDEIGAVVCLPWQDNWLRAAPESERIQEDNTQVQPLDITWMDDLALLVVADTPQELVQKI